MNNPIKILIISLMLMFIFLPGCSHSSRDYNVVFISLDTTRSDYVDTGKGAKAFTPALKRFAQKSLTFERAYTTIPQTLPAHLSLLTSYYPHECGVLSNQYSFDGRYKMLQEVLKENGYSTAGVISLGTLDSGTGIAAGFDQYREKLNEEGVFYTTAQRVTREALDLLKKIKTQKFFLFLHYSDPHSPYAPPQVNAPFTLQVDNKPTVQFNAHQGAILRTHIPLSSGTHHIRFKVENNQEDFTGFVIRRLEFSKNCSTTFQNIEFSTKHYGGSHVLKGDEGNLEVRCRGEGYIKIFQVIPLLNWKAAIRYYRQEVEYMDRYVGKFLGELEKEKLLDNTIVVIVGDHGEGLGEREHYFGHVRYLNRQFIEVPFMMHLPRVQARRITVPVSHIQVSPTLLEFMGLKHNGFSKDKSLIPLINSGKYKIKPVYSFAFKSSSLEDRLSVISWPYQCISSKDDSGTMVQEFYNFSLSQSFRKWDEFSPDVLTRNSGKTFLFLQQSFARLRGAFKNHQLANLNKNKQDIEKLKTIGYIQ